MILLVGGLGTRLRSVVRDVPKPMAEILGTPFLEYIVKYWITQGINRFILCVSYQREKIQTYFGSRFYTADIDYSIETTPLGTGGALLQGAKRCLRAGPTLLANGDTFFPVPMQKLLRFHRESKAEITISLTQSKDNRRYGTIELSDSGKVLQFGDSVKSRFMNGGLYLLEEGFRGSWSYLKEPKSLEQELIPEWIKRKRAVFGMYFPARFIDIGIPEDYHRAGNVILKPNKGERTWRGSK